MADVRHEDRRERIAVRVGVIAEDARRGHDLGRVVGRGVRVGDRDRRPFVPGGTKPGTQVGLATAAPVMLLPELSPRLVPLPSLRFQTPSRLVCGVVISLFLVAWIWLRLRATLQIRTSSIVPAKKPAAVPVVSSAAADGR